MPKVSVSKAKSDVPATNHSNKSVAEPPNGKPDVNSQPKNDAKVQTNELVVEKSEEGELPVWAWFVNGLYIWVKSPI